MRGHEPGGKNQSTDGVGAGNDPMKVGLNGEHPHEADGDGCHAQVKDRAAEDDDHHFHDLPDDDEDAEAEMNCSMGADGQCGQAGSEYCELSCPYRD